MQWICQKKHLRAVDTRLLLLILLLVFLCLCRNIAPDDARLLPATFDLSAEVAQRQSKLQSLVTVWHQQHNSLNRLQHVLACVPHAVRMQRVKFTNKNFELVWRDTRTNDDINVECWKSLQANISSVERSSESTVNITGDWRAL